MKRIIENKNFLVVNYQGVLNIKTDFTDEIETTEAGETAEITEKPAESFIEYEKYPQPVIILDAEFDILCKNEAAKILNLKPRVGTNIKKYADRENVEKLADAAEKDEFKIIKLNLVSSVKYCVAQPLGKDLTILVFYDALNFAPNGNEMPDKFNEIEKIMAKYNSERKKDAAAPVSHVIESNRKIIKINEHFRRHLINLSAYYNNDDDNKRYCDVERFLSKFASGIAQYVNPFGYKIGVHIEDNMFFYTLNEDDFLLINFLLSAAAFKYSVYNKIDIRFSEVYHAGISGILSYECGVEKDFSVIHADIFDADYEGEIKNMDYIDLNLAALTARGNGLKLNVRFKPDDGGKVCFDVLFAAKQTELKSPVWDGRENPAGEITEEEINEFAGIEFAGIFGE